MGFLDIFTKSRTSVYIPTSLTHTCDFSSLVFLWQKIVQMPAIVLHFVRASWQEGHQVLRTAVNFQRFTVPGDSIFPSSLRVLCLVYASWTSRSSLDENFEVVFFDFFLRMLGPALICERFYVYFIGKVQILKVIWQLPRGKFVLADGRVLRKIGEIRDFRWLSSFSSRVSTSGDVRKPGLKCHLTVGWGKNTRKWSLISNWSTEFLTICRGLQTLNQIQISTLLGSGDGDKLGG